jgi:hypothetical protein
MGFAFGGSFVWGILYTEPTSDYGPAKQNEKSAAPHTNPSEQNRDTAGTPPTVPQIPSDNLRGKKPSDDTHASEQPEKSWLQKVWTDPNATFAGAVAIFTFALVVVGAWQARRLRQTVEATTAASAVSREIGEKQVSAYVDISDAQIFFTNLGVLNNQAHPLVKIFATNTGQSPARDFIWNPTVQYFSAGILAASRSRAGELGANWRDIVGVGIAVGQTHEDTAMVPDMDLFKFLHEEGDGDKGTVVIRLRVQFEFEDVFDKRNPGEAYFSGVFRYASTATPAHRGVMQWSGKLTRMHRTDDWPATKTPDNQNKPGNA